MDHFDALVHTMLAGFPPISGATRLAVGLGPRAILDFARLLLMPAQALGELYNVLTRKAAWTGDRARLAVLAWKDAFPVTPATTSAMIDALDLAADHQLGIWDSFMLSLAAEAGCRILLSEDMQNGFTWRGITVVNPFASQQHPLFAALLS